MTRWPGESSLVLIIKEGLSGKLVLKLIEKMRNHYPSKEVEREGNSMINTQGSKEFVFEEHKASSVGAAKLVRGEWSEMQMYGEGEAGYVVPGETQKEVFILF